MPSREGPLSVPRSYREAFALLAAYSDQQVDAVAKAIEGEAEYIPPDAFAERITEATGDDWESATKIVSALVSIGIARADHATSLEDFARGVAESPDVEVDDERRDHLQSLIVRLGSSPTVETTAKAVDVSSDYDRTFHTARVFTDIRPVFGDDPTEPPRGSVVNHKLRINAFRNDQSEDYYVVLTPGELEELKQVIDRALVKADTLQSHLSEIGMPVFDMEQGR